MTGLVKALNGVADFTGRAVAWTTLLMVATTFVVVVLRYIFDIGFVAMQELIVYLHAILFMLGAAYTLRHDGHVRIDIYYRRLSDRGRAVVNLCGAVFLLLPTCVFIIWISWPYVADSWLVLEDSREAGGLPAVFLLKSLILLLPVLLALQGLAYALRDVLTLRGGTDSAPPRQANE